MDGFGAVVREPDEPVFHEPWEKRVFGMLLALGAQRIYTFDEMRHAIERMNPAHYLGSTYYEHWLAGLERWLVENGRLSSSELEAKTKEIRAASEADRDSNAPERSNSALADGLAQGIRIGASKSRGKGRARFRAGGRVRVRKMSPPGHTRCPRYVRGAIGTIERVHDKFVLPDSIAHRRGENPEIVYTVRFEGQELWGPQGDPAERVYVDLWESYLEPVRAKSR